MEELQERQQALKGLYAELKRLRSGESSPLLSYNMANAAEWTQSLREMITTSDFEMRRELVCRFVKKVIIYPDRKAKMIWDLPATLAWGGGEQVPDDLIGITKVGCGGTQFAGTECFWKELWVNLGVLPLTF